MTAPADESTTTTRGVPLERVHELQHDSSVLALAVSATHVFAGTHDGEILVWALGRYELEKRLQAHKRSVLCLYLTEEEADDDTASEREHEPRQLLLSSAGDAVISIWDPTTYLRLYEIYSTYDMGDIFSVVYAREHQTVYIGAQDTSIQWISLDDPRRRVAADAAQHPDKRQHRFFDSKAVGGGASTPRRCDDRWALIPRAQTTLAMDASAIRQFAHYGYVYCMLIARGPAHNLAADAEVLISGGGDGTVKLWRLGGGGSGHSDRASDDTNETGETDDSESDDSGAIHEVMTLGSDDAMSVLSLAIDGSFLYSGKLDGLVELWDLDTRQKLRVIQAHDSDVMALQMRWGYLWSASANGYAAKHTTVHYAPNDSVSQRYQCVSRWKAHDGKILASATTTFQDNRLYITGANDETVRIWRVPDQCSSSSAAAAATEDAMLQNLRAFIAHKTVSSRPEFAEDCHKGATFLCTLFKRLGGEVQMLVAAGAAHNPVVFAKFGGKPCEDTAGKTKTDKPEKRRRILFYGHYDVVAADPRKGSWASDPFAMRGTNGYLYGRGVSDNKGPLMAALYAVADLMQAKQLEADVLFLIEGEEEAGSRGFRETVRQHQALIGRVDYILLANSYWLDDATPCLTYGLRGVLHATVQVDAPHADLHSGVDGSALRDEPLSDLTAVLARLKGPRNRVQLPRFYDGVLPLRPEEEARFDAVVAVLGGAGPGHEHGVLYSAAHGVHSAPDAAALKQSLIARWREPNLTIHRYSVSGPDGSLVSAHACAHISIRLVPGQELDDVVASLRAFLADQFRALGSTNRLSVLIDNMAEPWLGDPDSYIFQTLEAAVVRAWHMDAETSTAAAVTATADTADTNADAPAQVPTPRRPLYIREGGSIPAIRFLEKQFGAPAAHLPCGQASDAAHLDNERLRVLNLEKSREIFKYVFQQL